MDKTWRERLAEIDEDIILYDGFDDAIMGYGQQFSHVVAVYDLDAVREILLRGQDPELSREEAEERVQEHLDFNVLGAWVGPRTPVFFSRLDGEGSAGVRPDSVHVPSWPRGMT